MCFIKCHVMSCHVVAYHWRPVMPRCTRAWHGLSTVMSYLSCCSTPLVSCHGVQSLARAIHCHVIYVMLLQHTTGVMSGQGVPEPGTVYPLSCRIRHVAAHHWCHVKSWCTEPGTGYPLSCHICHVDAAHHWCHVRPRCTRARHGLSTVMSYLSCQVAPLVSCQAKVYQSQARFIHCHVISVMSCCSTPLVSCQAKVYQSLARFIHWTDSLLVSPQTSFNKDNAREIIDTLSAGIKVSLTSGFAELSMFLLWVGISPPCLL